MQKIPNNLSRRDNQAPLPCLGITVAAQKLLVIVTDY
jgi:hypothetical protein